MPPPSWENLTAQAAMLAAFGAMLMWVLKVSAQKQDAALTQLSAMTQQLGRLVENQGAMVLEFRLRYERLASDAGTTANILTKIVEEIRDMRAEDEKRTQAIKELLTATHRLASNT